MGFMKQLFTKNKSNADTTSSSETATEVSESDWQTVELKKRRPGCTGMFWRSDPTGMSSLQSNDNWPRDGAMLRGTVVTDSDGEKWMLVRQVKQKGSEWRPAPAGAAMPFEYNNHYYLE